MAIVEIPVPDIIGDAEECVVVTWLKRVGDQVQKGEDLLVLQVEKVSYDVPSPVEGRLVEILVPQGQVARRGQALARIEVTAETGRGPSEEQGPAEGSSPSSAKAPERSRVLASPIARRLAREHHIDLHQIKGTGRGGRITEKDVRAFIQAQKGSQKPAPEAPMAAGEQTLPFAGMRAAIARRMHESLQTMAQLTLFTEADVTELVALRTRLKGSGEEVTYTDLIIRACALALREHPRVNARLEGDRIRLLPHIHIGVAVALDEGLVVPVVRDADKKDVREIARMRKALVERVRAGKISAEEAEEISGSTFTVTNLGMYDVDGFTPIVNPPEVAILGIGRIVDKVVIHQGKVAQRAMMVLSLSFDHRILDGAPAAAFLQSVRHYLESPETLV